MRQPLSELTNICLSSLSMLMAGLLLLLLTVSAFGGSGEPVMPPWYSVLSVLPEL